MNGLSDVRLALYSQELSEGQAKVAMTTGSPKLGRWALYRHRLVSRRALLNLTAEQLSDIGISPQQAQHEAMKGFWQD
jgi:uncharacterized protein YjiS (DUF1127 family)